MKGWMSHPKFKTIMAEGWNEEVQGNPMIILFKKLKNLKTHLKNLNKEHYSQISTRVEKARGLLQDTQQRLILDPTNRSTQKEEKSQKESYIKLMDFEENFFKEKSRIKWMKESDKNTKYFHMVVKSYIARNKILRLKDETG